MKKFHVYCLIKNCKPIYVGMSSNVKKRAKKHKLDKNFDSVFILKSFDKKNDALICENAIIRFISILDDNDFINGLNNVLKDNFLHHNLVKNCKI